MQTLTRQPNATALSALVVSRSNTPRARSISPCLRHRRRTPADSRRAARSSWVRTGVHVHSLVGLSGRLGNFGGMPTIVNGLGASVRRRATGAVSDHPTPTANRTTSGRSSASRLRTRDDRRQRFPLVKWRQLIARRVQGTKAAPTRELRAHKGHEEDDAERTEATWEGRGRGVLIASPDAATMNGGAWTSAFDRWSSLRIEVRVLRRRGCRARPPRAAWPRSVVHVGRTLGDFAQRRRLERAAIIAFFVTPKRLVCVGLRLRIPADAILWLSSVKLAPVTLIAALLKKSSWPALTSGDALSSFFGASDPVIAALARSGSVLPANAVLLFGPIPKSYDTYSLHNGEIFDSVSIIA